MTMPDDFPQPSDLDIQAAAPAVRQRKPRRRTSAPDGFPVPPEAESPTGEPTVSDKPRRRRAKPAGAMLDETAPRASEVPKAEKPRRRRAALPDLTLETPPLAEPEASEAASPPQVPAPPAQEPDFEIPTFSGDEAEEPTPLEPVLVSADCEDERPEAQEPSELPSEHWAPFDASSQAAVTAEPSEHGVTVQRQEAQAVDQASPDREDAAPHAEDLQDPPGRESMFQTSIPYEPELEVPLIETAAVEEAASEPPVSRLLDPGLLTEPADLGPPLVPLGAAPTLAGDADQPADTRGASASKAWGPVRGAIETATANLRPLLPISRVAQLRAQLSAAATARLGKVSALVRSTVLEKLPWLAPIGGRIRAICPKRRGMLAGAGLIGAALVGGIGAHLLLHGVPAHAPGPATPVAALPEHVARRLGQELELSVVPMPKGTTALFATGADQLDSALALSRRQAAGDGVVISLDALASAARQVLAWYGLGAAIAVRPTSGPKLTFHGEVPAALYPLARIALDNISTLLGQDPILHSVSVANEISKSSDPLFRAIFVGDPKPIVYTADGPREIGQSIYGGFIIREIDADSIVLAPSEGESKITVSVPLRESSATTVSGPSLANLPDRSAVVLAQNLSSRKE
jgi:hypothetical protein